VNIVSVLGSPRPKGNSTLIAERFTERARSLGATVRCYTLNTLNYRGCQACYQCKIGADRCVLKDDLTGVLEAVRDADILVMATPVYFGDVSSQLKAFIDRTFSFLVPDYATNPKRSRLAPGKRAVFAISQGHPVETMFADVFPRYDFFLKWYGFEETHVIRVCGMRRAGDVIRRTDVLSQAESLAERIMA